MKKVLWLLFLISQVAIAQNTNNDSTNQFTQKQLRWDYELFTHSLKEIHPALYQHSSKQVLDQKMKDLGSQISGDWTEEYFHIQLRQLVREIGCGHTFVYPSKSWYQQQKDDSKILPLEAYIIGQKIFVRTALDKDSLLKPGTEIIAIDENSNTEIISAMKSIQEKDGVGISFENYKIQKMFRTYYLFLYGRQDNYQVKYKSPEGKVEAISVKGGVRKPKSAVPDKVQARIYKEIKMTDNHFYIDSLNPSVGMLDINSFYRKDYKKFYQQVFERIAEENIQHLIIDLRYNGGGYILHGNSLLSYLLDSNFTMDFRRNPEKIKETDFLKMNFDSKMTFKLFNLMPDHDKTDPMRNHAIKNKPAKKNSYKGKIYVLTNGGTFSMSSYVSTKLRHNTDAVFIGQEIGGGENGSSAILDYHLTLPATGIRVSIPYYYLDHQVETRLKGRGLIPDYPIDYSLQDLLSEKDKEMEKVYELIKK